MSGSAPPRVDVLQLEGWAHNDNGEIAEGKLLWCKGGAAPFRHSRELQAHDVLRMQVVKGVTAFVGFAAESYDVEKHRETAKSIARVVLCNGSTLVRGLVMVTRSKQIAMVIRATQNHCILIPTMCFVFQVISHIQLQQSVAKI